tara:strand:+ start:712 stop:1503 length:792 start_codon:yes stop_codon:yes gene_type:complete
MVLGKPYNTIHKITKKHRLYNSLEFFGGNRNVNAKNVQCLIEAIKECNLLPLCPLLVYRIGGEYKIADGQHRYLAALELGLSFYVVVSKEPYDTSLIGKLNSNHKNWGLGDYAKYWANQSETSRVYKRYLEYYNENRITHGILIALYNKTHIRLHKEGGSKRFKTGGLVFNSLIRDHVEDRLYCLKKLQGAALNPVLKPVTLRKQQFQGAILTALNNEHFNFKKFLKNLYRSRHRFNELAKTVDMVHEIYRIENLRGRKRNGK